MLEHYASENQIFHEIEYFEKLLPKDDYDIDMSVLATFIPCHRTNKR